MNEFFVMSIKPGETLSKIATHYGVRVEDLQRWNNITDPDVILVGQEIVIYSDTPDTATAQPSPSVTPLGSEQEPVPNTVGSVDPSGAAVFGALALIFMLLILFRWLRRPAPSVSHPFSGDPPRPFTDSRVQVNDGERHVSAVLRRCYHDWLLMDNIMLPSGHGTTQIDHILIAPSVVFLIETKDMNGWIFGSPGERHWTQTYAPRYRGWNVNVSSRKYRFYNPLWQNEGHAKAMLKLGIVDRWRLRPVVVFVGDSEMKTRDKFLPFDAHEEIAARKHTWRMRGVVCMNLEELHRYIDFSVKASACPDWTNQDREEIHENIRLQDIPVTAESLERHVAFVQSVKEIERLQFKRRRSHSYKKGS
ncbi:MAG: NERD domain-containing protein [Aestuariivita sp.]|nr:NERD domain-containing protein [Aestuariivita sp.]MCY4347930.1 NERD domain-containing protein [Aestuariivita sp.]